ncbi:hypothetical protein BH09MYX1_BH09MYX1_36990 [soil metagenome]
MEVELEQAVPTRRAKQSPSARFMGFGVSSLTLRVDYFAQRKPTLFNAIVRSSGSRADAFDPSPE